MSQKGGVWLQNLAEFGTVSRIQPNRSQQWSSVMSKHAIGYTSIHLKGYYGQNDNIDTQFFQKIEPEMRRLSTKFGTIPQIQPNRSQQ